MRPRKMPWLRRRPSGYPDDPFLAGLDGLQKCRTLDISWVKMRFRIRYLHVAMQVAVITEAVAFVGLVLRVVRVVADEVMIGVCVTVDVCLRIYLFQMDHLQTTWSSAKTKQASSQELQIPRYSSVLV